MRIIAGSLKGRRIPPASVGEVRPTSDRVRESMFSTLESLGELGGLRVLDLFAGSGSLGLECISRGAGTCVFVERDRAVAKRLFELLQTLDVQDCCEVKTNKAESFLKSQGDVSTDKFGLVFLDPPYELFQPVDLLSRLCGSPHVEPGTRVVYESRSELDLFDSAQCYAVQGSSLLLERVRDKSFGDTVVSYLVLKES